MQYRSTNKKNCSELLQQEDAFREFIRKLDNPCLHLHFIHVMLNFSVFAKIYQHL